MSGAEQAVQKWWHRWMRTPRELRDMGVVGINMRNGRYLLPNNPRRLYQRVDNKIVTKGLAMDRGITVPETYGELKSPRDVSHILRILEGRDSFVMKPARGSGGKGVLVIAERDGDRFIKPSGASLSLAELKHHASNTLAGLYSLGGTRDQALLEYKVTASRVMTEMSYLGAPDVRIVMIHGYPVMAMMRASTKESDGRANLHQGAIGIGIDLASGKSVRAIHHGKSIQVHPDLKVDLVGRQLPEWDKMLEIAVSCYEMTELGYLGVDLMVDQDLGPLMIEVNARPGLAIQLANGVGLKRRLEPAIARAHEMKFSEGPEGRMAFSKERFQAELAARG